MQPESTNGSKRFLYVMPDLAGGGAEKHAITLLQHLSRAGIKIDLLLFKDIREYDTAGLSNIKVMALFGPKEKIKNHPCRFISRIIRIAKNYDVLIGGLQLWPSYTTAVVGRLLRKKVVWLNHNHLSTCLSTYNMPKYHRWLISRLGIGCDRLIAVSEGVKLDLIRNFGFSEQRVSVIYNAFEIGEIQRLASESLTTEDQAIFRKPTIITAGRLSIQKNYHLLLRAFAKVSEQVADCNLAILGKGPEEESLMSLAFSLGIKDRVFMLGFRENPFKYFARASMFVLSSRFEGFGRVLVEAVACGCPVISVDCPSGPAEVLDGGKYGILIEPEDEDALADAIRSLLTDEAKREELRKLGLRRAVDFDAPTIAKQYVEVLNSL